MENQEQIEQEVPNKTVESCYLSNLTQLRLKMPQIRLKQQKNQPFLAVNETNQASLCLKQTKRRLKQLSHHRKAKKRRKNLLKNLCGSVHLPLGRKIITTFGLPQTHACKNMRISAKNR
jgi:hypothetical protein